LLYHSLPAEAENLTAIAIPLRYQNKILGVYNLFIDNNTDISEQETLDMLTNIAQHTSLAIEKSRLEDDAKRVSIMQERTMLAHELHDSLAQTLASLRFRMAVLENTLENLMNTQALSEVAQIREDLDTANSELRELLTHFRVRMDDRGLIPATENLLNRFEKDTNISVFFQNDSAGIELPPEVEIQVLHIIQEALSNIRKHSHAENVRVLIRCRHNRDYHVLIEDDGVGIDDTIIGGQPGEHIGLKIMRERAKRINAELTIDTEPGEGTRVELDFNTEIKPNTGDDYQAPVFN
jgi:two-component system nitrate/nitrite sensor histidine kinase NarX